MVNLPYMRLLIFLVIIAIFGLVLWLTGAVRLGKTLYLILRITPYEQTVTGSPVILVVGDSTGYGTGAEVGKDSIAGLIGSDYSAYSVVNRSKNGRTIGEAVEEMKKLPSDERYELIVLQMGSNDILQKRPLDVVRSDLSLLFAIALEHSDHVVMITCGNVGTASRFAGTKRALEYEQLTRLYREMVIPLAAESGVRYVDLFEEPGVDMFLREPKKYLSIDGLHPSSAGYAYWYERLQPALVSMLPRTPTTTPSNP